MQFEQSIHFTQEIERRGIPQLLIDSVLANPQQIVQEKQGRKAYQSILDFGNGKQYLLLLSLEMM